MYGKEFTPMELLRQLLHHADSLETLVLNYDDDWGKGTWKEIDFAELHFGSDLSRLTRLKKLSTNFSALFGIVVPTEGRYGSQIHQRDAPHVHLPSILPDTLEDMEVLVCDERIVSHLQELAEARSKQRYPKLRKVRCMMAEEWTDRNIAKVEMPGVDIRYEFLDVNQRAHLIYEFSGCGPNDSDSLFDKGTLFGLHR
ncbi:MAG: hypothetical protein M1823_007049 [Watsoniomyces obsoletus]|nr:MAG: hypothetical protein M1823_007049 [Watsoniomyces obsoletus]